MTELDVEAARDWWRDRLWNLVTTTKHRPERRFKEAWNLGLRGRELQFVMSGALPPELGKMEVMT